MRSWMIRQRRMPPLTGDFTLRFCCLLEPTRGTSIWSSLTSYFSSLLNHFGSFSWWLFNGALRRSDIGGMPISSSNRLYSDPMSSSSIVSSSLIRDILVSLLPFPAWLTLMTPQSFSSSCLAEFCPPEASCWSDMSIPVTFIRWLLSRSSTKSLWDRPSSSSCDLSCDLSKVPLDASFYNWLCEETAFNIFWSTLFEACSAWYSTVWLLRISIRSFSSRSSSFSSRWSLILALLWAKMSFPMGTKCGLMAQSLCILLIRNFWCNMFLNFLPPMISSIFLM